MTIFFLNCRISPPQKTIPPPHWLIFPKKSLLKLQREFTVQNSAQKLYPPWLIFPKKSLLKIPFVISKDFFGKMSQEGYSFWGEFCTVYFLCNFSKDFFGKMSQGEFLGRRNYSWKQKLSTQVFGSFQQQKFSQLQY